MDISAVNMFLMIGGPAISLAGGYSLLETSKYSRNLFFLSSSRVVSCTAKILGGGSVSASLVGYFTLSVFSAIYGLSDRRVTYIGAGLWILGLCCIFYEQIVRAAQCFQKVFYCKAKSGLEQQRDYGTIESSSPREIELA